MADLATPKDPGDNPPHNALAEARIAQHEARNLLDSIWDLPKDQRPAVKARARALYAKAWELYAVAAAPRSQADEALRRALAATPIKAPSRPLSRRAAAVWGR